MAVEDLGSVTAILSGTPTGQHHPADRTKSLEQAH